VAFSQFGNVMFLIARDATLGTPILDGSTVNYQFIAQYNAATSDEDRLNVVRELYRLLVPNGISFSHLHEYGVDEATAPFVEARHIHQVIMLMNTAAEQGLDPSDPTNWASYYAFDLAKYADFPASLQSSSVNCPAGTPSVDFSSETDPSAPALPELFASTSEIDGETVLDVCNPQATYVPTLPTYMPFGVGYRRCPGELFSYQITQMMLARFKNLEFYIGDAPAEKPVIGVAPFTVVPNIFYASATA
jgi:hypothetical protein